jgi:hypothetical protein
VLTNAILGILKLETELAQTKHFGPSIVNTETHISTNEAQYDSANTSSSNSLILLPSVYDMC